MTEMTKEIIEKISKTKSENGRCEIIEGLVRNDIPEQSNIKLAVPTHRKKNFISFDQYKELIREGKTINELNTITSKHLISFYNVMARGKITLSKEEFEKLYSQGVSLDEIAKRHDIARGHITYLREFYGIKRKGATFIKRLQNEVPLSQEAKDVIIGSLLGDGHITPNGYFSEKHSEKQVGYLEWKADFLKPILNSKSFYFGKYIDKRYGSTNYSFCLRTTTHSFLHEMRKKFYKNVNGNITKTLPKDIGELMNERVLAIWFMDDGSTDWHTRKEDNSQRQCKFSSESFSMEENQLLLDVLVKKWGIISNIRFRMPNIEFHPYIRVETESSEKLLNVVRPFVVPELAYKVSLDAYLFHSQRQLDKEEIAKAFIERHKIPQHMV